jgi:hypothetical protein
MQLLKPILIICGAALLSLPADGQTVIKPGETKLDEAPWAHARAAGLQQALSPISNGIGAPYYNPAGIGDLHSQGNRPLITRLNLPHIGATASQDAQGLSQNVNKGLTIGSSQVATELLKSAQGVNQYARFSAVPNIQIWRMFFGLAHDYQVAATPADASGDRINLEAQTATGPYAGFSFGHRGDFYMGVTVGYDNRERIAGQLTRNELNDDTARTDRISELRHSYTGMPVHAGLIWHLDADWRPAFSLAARHAGGTKYESDDPQAPGHKADEDLTVGLSLSPELGSWGFANMVLEGSDLTDQAGSFRQKTKGSLEITFGERFGQEAGLSLQLGYHAAGLAYGLGFNAGILGCHIGSRPEDVGADQHHMIERRLTANFAVNIAAF